MKKIFCSLGLLLACFPAFGQRITASITVTNQTVNGMTFTLNGDTRTFTNLVVSPSGAVLTNADVTGCGSKTNLLQQIYLQPFSQVTASGPTGSFAVCGIANGRDGKLITVVNQTGFQMTIANESGSDPTAANRIRTLGAGADLVLTNSAVTLRYSANISRWLIDCHNP